MVDNSTCLLGYNKNPLEGKVVDEPCASLYFMQYGYCIHCAVFYLCASFRLADLLQPVHKLLLLNPLYFCHPPLPLPSVFHFFIEFICNLCSDNAVSN